MRALAPEGSGFIPERRARFGQCISGDTTLGSLAARVTSPLRGMNFPATQCLCLKHSLEPERGFAVGFFGLFVGSDLLVYRSRIPSRH